MAFRRQTDTAEETRTSIAKTGDLYNQNGVSPFATERNFC